MKKFIIGKTKCFFALTLVFILIFSIMPAVPVLANQQVAMHGLNLRPQRNLICSTGARSAAIRNDGSLWFWGQFFDGQNNRARLSSVPEHIMDGVASVSGNMIVKEDGSLWVWGFNDIGQFGNGSSRSNPTPPYSLTPIKIMENVVSAIPTMLGGLAIQSDGSLWSWGKDLGAFTPQFDINNIRPERVMENVASVSFSGANATSERPLINLTIVRTDGGLYTLGTNCKGQLGDGTRTERLNPVRIMDNVVAAYTSLDNTMAIQADGSLWIWGWGFLAFDDNDHLRPVRIMENVASGYLGIWSAYAVQKDGHLWGWGSAGLGWFSISGMEQAEIAPVRIMDSTLYVSAAGGHILVVRKDGSLWSFGANSEHAPVIGDGTTNNAPLPVMIWGPGSVSTDLGALPPVQPTQPTPPTMPPITTPQTGQITITTTANPANGGTASGGGTFQQNADVTLTATPNQGWTFTGWYVNGSPWSQNPRESTQALNNWTFEARFAQANQMPPITTQPPITTSPPQTTRQYLGVDISAFQIGSLIEENPGSFNMGGVTYNRGLTARGTPGGMRTQFYALYNISGRYTTFSGLYGPIDGAHIGSSIPIYIYGDGVRLARLTSTGGNMPNPFSVDVTGVQQLRIRFGNTVRTERGHALADAVLQ